MGRERLSFKGRVVETAPTVTDLDGLQRDFPLFGGPFSGSHARQTLFAEAVRFVIPKTRQICPANQSRAGVSRAQAL